MATTYISNAIYSGISNIPEQPLQLHGEVLHASAIGVLKYQDNDLLFKTLPTPHAKLSMDGFHGIGCVDRMSGH